MFPAVFAWLAGKKAELILYGVVAAAGAAAVMYVWASGYSSAMAKCNEAELRGRIAMLERDLAIQSAAARRADEIETRLAEAERKNAGVVNEIPSHTGSDYCKLTGDDLRRMLGLK